MKPYALAGTCLLTVMSTIAVQGTITARRIATLTPEQEEILGHLSIVYLDDGQGGTNKTIRIEGVNVQLVNGLGATNGFPPDVSDSDISVTNGLGNLIVGYNESLNSGRVYVGSHNLICGVDHSFPNYGSIITGRGNEAIGPLAAMLGGLSNTAIEKYAVVSGGENNVARSQGSVVIGGQRNCAGSTGGGANAVAIGGVNNETISGHGVIVGGTDNVVLGSAGQSVVCGGLKNTAHSSCSTVLGGEGNYADGDCSSISGGFERRVSTMNTSGNTHHDWIGGGLWQDQ